MTKSKPKSSNKFYIIIGILVILVIAFAFLSAELYSTHQAAPTKINNYTRLQNEYYALNNSYMQLKSNLASPYTELLYNGSFIVPGYSNNFVFYNSTYGIYNNYTLMGTHNLTFDLPYFGYVIIDLHNFSSASDNAEFCIYSNSTAKYLSPSNLIVAPFSNEPTKAITSDCYAPDLNYSESFIAPVPYGNTTISFSNLNEFPAVYNVSITYIGIRYSNLTSISFNYSK